MEKCRKRYIHMGACHRAVAKYGMVMQRHSLVECRQSSGKAMNRKGNVAQSREK